MARPSERTRHKLARYDIGEQIAVGGMGSIFRAHDRLLDRPVALKSLRVEREVMRASMTTLFRREYETLTALAHPNTVRAYDYGFDEEGPFYTMELLSGTDLSRAAPLPWKTACAVLRDVSSALALIHARKLVHRDVSPNNVRVLATGSAKLIDFGALTFFGAQRDIVGTPQFMAPESARGQSLDQRSDLFSLGALAYWMLTNRLLYRAKVIEGLEQAWRSPFLAPSQVVGDIPRELDALIQGLVRLERDARPPTAAHVIEQLTSIANLPPELESVAIARSYVERPPLVERESALAALNSKLVATLDGRGGSALVEADAGLGRTALLERFAVDCQLAGLTVLRTTAPASTRPLELCEVLVNLGAQLYPRRGRSARPSDRGSRPDHPPVRATSAAEVVERRANLATLFEDELLDFSLRAPLVIIVDDAHAADVDSLRVLAAMTEELARHPLLLVLGVRREGAGLEPAVYSKLSQLASVVPLAPLTREGMVALASSVLGAAPNTRRAGLALHQASGGLPGPAIDLLRVSLHRGEIQYVGGTFTVPYDIALSAIVPNDVLHARVAGLAAHTHTLLSLLSVSSSALSVAQLQRGTELDERQVALAVEELTHRNIVAELTEGYAITSEILRGALVDRLDAQTLRACHAQVALALSVGPKTQFSPLDVGHHLIESGGAGQLRGAALIASVCSDARFEVAALASATPRIEAALRVYEQQKKSDEQLVSLLIALSMAGFFGDLRVQRRYLQRTFVALYRRTGLYLTKKLRSVLGLHVALLTGLAFGFFRGMFERRREQRTFIGDLESLFAVASTATAACASAFDRRGAAQAVQWIEPFRVTGDIAGPRLALEFSLAVAELVDGMQNSSDARYTRLERLLRVDKVFGADPRLIDLMRLGVLHARAQWYVSFDDPRALALADELEQRSAFFAPHAETIRAGYCGLRGDELEMERHRARAEALALRGGLSWSALTLLTLRLMYAHALANNALGLVGVVALLEQQKHLSDEVGTLQAMALAHLERARGNHALAAAAYTRICASPDAVHMPHHPLDMAFFAETLNRLGRHEEAAALCRKLLERDELSDVRRPSHRLLVQQLALASAYAGDLSSASETLDKQLVQVRALDNPLALGSVHHALALVAIVARDPQRFLLHERAAAEQFRTTHSRWFISEHEALIARARAAGVAPAVPEAAAQASDTIGDTGTTLIERARTNDESGTTLVEGARRRLSNGNTPD